MSETRDDVGDESQVKTKGQVRRLKKEQEKDWLRHILTTYGGRAFVWSLLSQCGVYRTSFTGNAATYFNEGKRQIGLWLLEEVFEADPKAFNLMQTEAVERGERK